MQSNTWKVQQNQGFSRFCNDGGESISRPPRYDHFDIPPYMNCRVAGFIGYSIFLEIFLEMRFSVAFGVSEKSVFTRLFGTLQKSATANFQDRLVMTTSHTPPESRQACVPGAGRGYIRQRRSDPPWCMLWTYYSIFKVANFWGKHGKIIGGRVHNFPVLA